MENNDTPPLSDLGASYPVFICVSVSLSIQDSHTYFSNIKVYQAPRWKAYMCNLLFLKIGNMFIFYDINDFFKISELVEQLVQYSHVLWRLLKPAFSHQIPGLTCPPLPPQQSTAPALSQQITMETKAKRQN